MSDATWAPSAPDSGDGARATEVASTTGPGAQQDFLAEIDTRLKDAVLQIILAAARLEMTGTLDESDMDAGLDLIAEGQLALHAVALRCGMSTVELLELVSQGATPAEEELLGPTLAWWRSSASGASTSSDAPDSAAAPMAIVIYHVLDRYAKQRGVPASVVYREIGALIDRCSPVELGSVQRLLVVPELTLPVAEDDPPAPGHCDDRPATTSRSQQATS